MFDFVAALDVKVKFAVAPVEVTVVVVLTVVGFEEKNHEKGLGERSIIFQSLSTLLVRAANI